MQNSKLNKSEDDHRKRLIDWLVKIKLLKEQIEKLEQFKDLVIISISVFLLKCQIIEFELKQTIFTLDFHLYSQNRSKLINRRVRTPRDLEDLTIGQLVREFRQFIVASDSPVVIRKNKNSEENNVLNQLKYNLDRLVEKRNVFTHKLFSLGRYISMLTEEAQEGIKIANKTLVLLESLENELKTYES